MFETVHIANDPDLIIMQCMNVSKQHMVSHPMFQVPIKTALSWEWHHVSKDQYSGGIY